MNAWRRLWWNGWNRDSASALVLLLCAVVVGGMGVYPPWEAGFYADGTFVAREPLGYSWIFAPPPLMINSEMTSVSIDFKQLGVEWMTVVLLTTAVVAALKIRPRDTKA